ncbi:hypothetical protein ACHWQZ_G007844 [Mnemiopsis leidyi]
MFKVGAVFTSIGSKHHKEIVIKHCRLTASGSLFFEFDNEGAAKMVHDSWSEKFFGGNSGMRKPGESNTTGVIKHVYDDLPEEELRNELMDNYKDDIESCEF